MCWMWYKLPMKCLSVMHSQWSMLCVYRQPMKCVMCFYRQPIECGQTIRMTHVSTNRNLHSHHFQSPLSHNLEVSAYGDNGEGDEGLSWARVYQRQPHNDVTLEHSVLRKWVLVYCVYNACRRPLGGNLPGQEVAARWTHSAQARRNGTVSTLSSLFA